MLNNFRGLLLLLLSLLGTAHAADTGWLTSPQNDHARVRVQAVKVNDHINALLSVELEPGWKTYWRSPGEGGVAPQITWQSAVQAQWYWPVPSRFEISGLTTQGYHQHVTIPIVISGQVDDVLDGTLTLSTCSNVCLLTDYRLHLDFNQPIDAGFSQDFNANMRKIPADSGISADLSVHSVNGDLQITGTSSEGWKNPQIFFDPIEGGFLPGDPQIRVEQHRLNIVVPVTDEWGDKPQDLSGKHLSFVLTNGEKAQQTLLVVEKKPSAWHEADLSPDTRTPGTVQMLLFALLGGLILNLMPCVLPVMGMKLNTVLHSGSDTTRIRLRFLATSAGIVTSFMLLAGMLSLLKITGSSLGWGMQFQNPWFIGLMVAVTFVFALNLFGVFEMLLPSSAMNRLATAGGTGWVGSFCEGMFATLLATPCSAPFLGTAVAFALAAPVTQLWLIFIMLGVGMSLPWLFVAVVPKSVMLLPRPGRWMNVLKAILGLMMLASSFWLVTLLNLHLGEECGSIISLLMAFVAIAALLLPCAKTPRVLQLIAVGVALFAGFELRGLMQTDLAQVENSSVAQIHWQPLDEAAIQTALSQGKRVFIDISADWCVTCKVNEHRVLNQPDIIAALNRPDVVALRGDWSKPSVTISEFLQKRKRYAIPFNQVYGPAMPEGEILPPLLNKTTVLNALDQAKG